MCKVAAEEYRNLDVGQVFCWRKSPCTRVFFDQNAHKFGRQAFWKTVGILVMTGFDKPGTTRLA